MAYYRSCLGQVFLALERHPRLLTLHLDLIYSLTDGIWDAWEHCLMGGKEDG